MIKPDRQDLLTKHFERHFRVNSYELNLGYKARWPVLGTFAEGIRKDPLNTFFGVLLAEHWNWAADPLREQASVVEPEQVIGMVVRHRDRVNPQHPLAEQLHPHLGR